ncbi:MAG TPA: barstar family protein [Gemmatimonadaceae bacterium]|nr:barstar family protein [Gemmatimonadaceae bacterium]
MWFIRRSRFCFGDVGIPASPALIADVPSGIAAKAALLDELSRELRFPDYFGGNWDALEECIRDLSWIPPGPVVLRHRDIPLVKDLPDSKTYLSILSDAVDEWKRTANRDLVVVFPREARAHIARVLRST